MVKVLILRTAGTNCDEETKAGFELAGASVDKIHIKQVLKNPQIIHRYQIFCLPGGFTYGDDISSAKILALEIKHWVIEELQRFKDDGKLILGICNGFQVLVKSDFLGGFKVSLVENTSGKFEDRWIHLKINPELDSGQKSKIKNIWTKDLPEVISLPVAHAEGRFVTPEKVLKELKTNNQIVFHYVDKKGNPALHYPENPNGSLGSVAGICDETGRILGLMPHPERYIFSHQHPEHREPAVGMQIFKNAVEFIVKG